jgi:1-aminocyclopropane-1-carboxylate deaminase
VSATALTTITALQVKGFSKNDKAFRTTIIVFSLYFCFFVFTHLANMSNFLFNKPLFFEEVQLQKIDYYHWGECTVKRFDQMHAEINGNKWFKLKYNLQEAVRREASCLVTFGGAYSNHLHAFAALSAYHNLPCIAIVRGERPPVLSSTLRFLEVRGVALFFISRSEYADKESEEMKMWIYEKWPGAYLIPEGGSNYLGLNGAMEMVSDGDGFYDHWLVCSGTGTTAAALLIQAPDHVKVHVFGAIKGKASVENEIRTRLRWFFHDEEAVEDCMQKCVIYDDKYFGGFGKQQPALIEFMTELNSDMQLPADVVYTAKMFFQMKQMKKPNEGSVLIFHTGGLQGNPEFIFD